MGVPKNMIIDICSFLWSPLEQRISSFLELSRERSMKPLFPSSYEVSHVRPRVLKLATSSLRLLFVIQVTGMTWSNNNPAPQPPQLRRRQPRRLLLRLSLRPAHRRRISFQLSRCRQKRRPQPLNWNLLSRHYYARGTLTKM